MLAKLVGSLVPGRDVKVDVTAFLALPTALLTAEPIDLNCPPIPLPVLETDAAKAAGSGLDANGDLLNGIFMVLHPAPLASAAKPSTAARYTLFVAFVWLVTRSLLMIPAGTQFTSPEQHGLC